MNIQQNVTESADRSKLIESTDTCLHGRWLIVARMLWIALVAIQRK